MLVRRSIVGLACAVAVAGVAAARGPGDAAAQANPRAAYGPQTIGKGEFESPETALWDERTDTYLVSNVNGGLTALDDNGFISRVMPDGTMVELKWIDGEREDVRLNGPKGMLFADDELVVADVQTLRFFDRVTGEPTREIPVQGAYMLNDPARAPDGTLFVSDTGSGNSEHPGAVYRIDPRRRMVSVVAEGTQYDRPDGLVVEGGSLLVAPFGAKANRVYRLTPEGERIPFATMPKPKLDGLLVLPDGSLIVTSWAGKEVYRVQENGTRSEVVIRKVPSPAQIGYDEKRERLLLPVLQEDKLLVYTLPLE